MNSIFISRMRENRLWFVKMSVVFGVLFSVCLYKNLSGITFPVMAAALILFSVLFLKKVEIRIQKGSICYFAGIFLLGISTVLTDSGFFHFFNIVGIVLLFIMVMVHQLYRDDEWGFSDYVKKFFIMVWTWIISAPEPFLGVKLKECRTEKAGNRKMVFAVLYGIVAALILMLIVMPLLISSDQIFSRIFHKIFDFLSPEEILRDFDFGNMIGAGLTFLFGGFSIYAFFAALFKMNLSGKTQVQPGRISPLTGITFAALLALVYVFYSGIQILFLFLRLDRGLPQGITYSAYAHEGFWQLLFVSLINFVTVIVCIRIFEDNRILRMLLTLVSVCTCIMILSAAYRMVLYVKEYDLSFLRVLVLWFLTVLMVIFFGVIRSIYRRKFGLFRYITAVVSVCYILFSFIRVDACIAGYNIGSGGVSEQTDLYYLIADLSQDAVPQIARLTDPQAVDDTTFQYLAGYFANIIEMNEEKGVREWNYSRTAASDAAEKWLGIKE